jgi:predicted DsbA family dithiol-disulfide isomerase
MPYTKDKILLHSDFNCPFCYALDEILTDLDLGADVSWRGAARTPIACTHHPNPSLSFGTALGGGPYPPSRLRAGLYTLDS